ncbi:unnamed protein product [Bemisia tabaci]|uniref:Gustatory receptor n=1 Tax=Bemisia tabaci TaxID=7038 RepID=A0A9P0C6K4_BEMTA|nr:unnamed protein product [Bemisia tabaci]
MKDMPAVWTTATLKALPAKTVAKKNKGRNQGSFRSQVKALEFFEFILGHYLSLSEPGSKRLGGKRKYQTSILSGILIVIPALGVLGSPIISLDQSIIYMVVIMLHYLTLKICIGSQERLHKLIDQIELFDKSFADTYAFEYPHGRNVWWGCLWVLLLLTFPIPFMLFFHDEIFSHFEGEPYSWIVEILSMTFHGSTVLQRSLIFVHFISIGRGMKFRFSLIKELLESELNKSEPGSSAANLEWIRTHHARLSVLVDSMNESCCKRLIFPVLSIAVEFLYIFFRYVFRDDFHINPVMLANLLTNLLALKVVASVSEAIALESRMPLYVVRAVLISKLPFLCQAQIMMFQDQILANPVQISAGGFFNLDNKLLTELVLLIVTYCTVILQLVPNDEDDEDEPPKTELSNATSSEVNNTK